MPSISSLDQVKCGVVAGFLHHNTWHRGAVDWKTSPFAIITEDTHVSVIQDPRDACEGRRL